MCFIILLLIVKSQQNKIPFWTGCCWVQLNDAAHLFICSFICSSDFTLRLVIRQWHGRDYLYIWILFGILICDNKKVSIKRFKKTGCCTGYQTEWRKSLKLKAIVQYHPHWPQLQNVSPTLGLAEHAVSYFLMMVCPVPLSIPTIIS